ncbi:MAG TPA: Rrf2 family transcriptional regulator [Flavisolibacter sp.]|nr:Rrf2 family transcriptional regulator [Flavisolibacter sp.]
MLSLLPAGHFLHLCNMLSVSCKYAIRSAVYLMTLSKSGVRAGIKEVAREIEANEHTTGKILQELVRAGIISSAKGPSGGFFIAADAAPVYIIDIVKLVDGVHLFFDCGLGLRKCSEVKPCPIHFTYKAAREKLYEKFSAITIADLAKDITKGKAFLKR